MLLFVIQSLSAASTLLAEYMPSVKYETTKSARRERSGIDEDIRFLKTRLAISENVVMDSCRGRPKMKCSIAMITPTQSQLAILSTLPPQSY